MKEIVRAYAIVLIAIVISGCSGKSPGPLEGTWQMKSPIPLEISFRDGETESLGIIEKVSYEVKEGDVVVTYLDGISRGTTMRFTITGKGTVKSAFGTLRRVK